MGKKEKEEKGPNLVKQVLRLEVKFPNLLGYQGGHQPTF